MLFDSVAAAAAFAAKILLRPTAARGSGGECTIGGVGCAETGYEVEIIDFGVLPSQRRSTFGCSAAVK
jgi:hypothetical protein